MQYFEDFHVGQRIPFDRYPMTQNEIIEFASGTTPKFSTLTRSFG